MIIKTDVFQSAANAILTAISLDKNVASLELVSKESKLYMNATNKEFYVSTFFDLTEATEFRAVVDAKLFLNLISGITASEFELNVEKNNVDILIGGSKYKVPLIFENEVLLELPVITLSNATVDMKIDDSILKSILNINSKEIAKGKKLDVNELQKYYFIDETGCFTFTNSACLNSFTLEKPVKLLLNERIVKLFKLFNSEVDFKFGVDPTTDGNAQTKVVFSNDNVYVAAIVTCDDILIKKVQGPCEATKKFISENYTNHVVFSSDEMTAAVSRLMLFAKNSINASDVSISAVLTITSDKIIIKDVLGNAEVINTESNSFVDGEYKAGINLFDIKYVIDCCKNEHLTMNFGNHRSIVLTHGAISNVIAERID